MSREMHNMATTHPGLLKWFASKNPFFVFLKIIPLLVLFIWMVSPLMSAKEWNIGLYIAGLFTWSFFEYATHRWFYHTIFKNRKVQWFLEAFHLHHHHNLTDYRVLNAGLLLVYPLGLFFWLGMYLFTFDLELASWFGLGILTYYFFYENVHYFIHFKVYESGYMKFIQKYHLYHHYKRWHKNFGNTVTFWDKLFGTYDSEYKSFEITKEIEQELIRH